MCTLFEFILYYIILNYIIHSINARITDQVTLKSTQVSLVTTNEGGLEVTTRKTVHTVEIH